MANDKFDNETSITILYIRIYNNRAALGSIYNEIKTMFRFWRYQEFVDDRIHTLINDQKIIRKLNPNVHSYYVNSEFVDLETPKLLNSSQSVQGISLNPEDSISNSNYTAVLGANKTLQFQGVTSTHSIYISNYSEDTPALNANRNSSNL